MVWEVAVWGEFPGCASALGVVAEAPSAERLLMGLSEKLAWEDVIQGLEKTGIVVVSTWLVKVYLEAQVAAVEFAEVNTAAIGPPTRLGMVSKVGWR